uniref:SMI1_KNR4 domain-containing protein n=2 Tax=cellular organisms TaxID=131567 RepID=A0A0R3R5W4_9BILA
LVEPIAERLRKIAMEYHLTEGQLNGPAEISAVDGLSTHLGVELPQSYIEFLKTHDGGEGLIGDSYIIFWKVEELVAFNREYEVETYAPGIFLFASNGGGEGYGFDTLDAAMSVVRIPFIGMNRQYAISVASDLPDLFARLADQNDGEKETEKRGQIYLIPHFLTGQRWERCLKSVVDQGYTFYEEASDAYAVMRQEFLSDYPRPDYPAEGSFLPWAVTDNGETFVWLVDGEPDSWKVAIHSSDQGEEEVYNFGCVEFILKLLSRDISSKILPGAKATTSWQGSGPAPGVLGLEPGSVSSKAIQNYFPSTKNDTVLTTPVRSGTSAASRYRQAGNTVPPGSDVDHMVDLPLGGNDTTPNMSPLDKSVNRSLGAQIYQQAKGLPPGTKINNVKIGD